jgi:hypothetical protein
VVVQFSSAQIDKENCLVGFFNNPKRFNVAVTRAKALLVVFGHPALLKADSNWHALVSLHNAGLHVLRALSTLSIRVSPVHAISDRVTCSFLSPGQHSWREAGFHRQEQENIHDDNHVRPVH